MRSDHSNPQDPSFPRESLAWDQGRDYPLGLGESWLLDQGSTAAIECPDIESLDSRNGWHALRPTLDINRDAPDHALWRVNRNHIFQHQDWQTPLLSQD